MRAEGAELTALGTEGHRRVDTFAGGGLTMAKVGSDRQLIDEKEEDCFGLSLSGGYIRRIAFADDKDPNGSYLSGRIYVGNSSHPFNIGLRVTTSFFNQEIAIAPMLDASIPFDL